MISAKGNEHSMMVVVLKQSSLELVYNIRKAANGDTQTYGPSSSQLSRIYSKKRYQVFFWDVLGSRCLHEHVPVLSLHTRNLVRCQLPDNSL